MRVRLPLLTLASLFCMGASAKPVVEKSIENNLRWDGAYVVCKGDSVTYRYVDDETGELISLRDASFDTGYDIGFYVNHENGASEFVHENPYTFFPSEGDQVGYTDLEFLDGKYVTDDFLTSTDKYKMATYGGWQEVQLNEYMSFNLKKDCSYQLFKDQDLVEKYYHNKENYFNDNLYVHDINHLRIFDGDSLRDYRISFQDDRDFIYPSHDTICLGDSVIFYNMVVDKYFKWGKFGYFKFLPNVSQYYVEMIEFYSDQELSIRFPEEGEYTVQLSLDREFSTQDFSQENIIEQNFFIVVKDCETGCSEPELSEDVRLLINGCHCNDTICYREGTVIRIENWDKIQEESNGNVNYTLEIQPDGIKVNLTDNYWGDSLDAGFHYFNVVRTDACGRESRDSLFLFVRPQLPHVQVTTAETISEGEDIIVRIDNWKELQNLEPYISYYVSLDGRTYSFYNDTCHIKSSEIRPLNDGYCKFTVNGGSYCNYETIEMVVKVEEAEKECPKDTVHIKPISFDIVQNGVCDFSLVYTLKDKDGCELFYAIDLDMDDCSGDDGNGVINLTVDGSYIYFDEETKVSIFSIDGRKMFDGKYKSVKLKSGIYIITTANAYRKVFIK